MQDDNDLNMDILLQLYSPLEFLFSIAAFTTLAENFLPQLIALPKVCHELKTLANPKTQPLYAGAVIIKPSSFRRSLVLIPIEICDKIHRYTTMALFCPTSAPPQTVLKVLPLCSFHSKLCCPVPANHQ